jgi:hypothetical protein
MALPPAMKGWPELPRALAFSGWSDLDVLHICRNMRASDVAEVFALRPDCDAFALYRDMASLGGRHLWFEVVRPVDAMLPIALFGVVGSSPGTGVAHLIGTPELSWSDSRQIATRIKARVIPAMLAEGLHRVEAFSLAAHPWAGRFLRAAGATRVEPRPAMGKDGEDFAVHVWLAGDLPYVKPALPDPPDPYPPRPTPTPTPTPTTTPET